MLEYGIVLTGGIASGKSSVARILAQKGFEIIDADCIAHQVLEMQQEKIKKVFSEAFCAQKIDRMKLGEIVFKSAEKRKKLEEIMHPEIEKVILQKALSLEKMHKYYFLDIPLFFEVGGRKVYNAKWILLIYCSKELQIERLCKRNNLSKEQALQRINSQISLELKKGLSDEIINNSKSLEHLQNAIELFLKKYKIE